MAKKTRRRRVSRRRTASRKPTRRRRNPANPSGEVYVRGRGWKPIPRYMKRRKRSSRRGRAGTLKRGFHAPRGYVRGGPKRSRRRTRRNPPAHRRHRSRRHGTRRRYRRNPGHRSYNLRSNPLAVIRSTLEEAFSANALETVVHTGIGLGGTLAGAKVLYGELIPALDTPVGRVGTTFGTAVLGSVATSMVMGRAPAARVLVGGMIAALWRGLTEVLPADQGIIPTLGENDDEFRRAVQEEVLREMRGGGMGDQSVYLQPAGVEEHYIQAAGSEAYLTGKEGKELTEYGVGNGDGMGAYLTEKETEWAEAGMGDEFSRSALPERF